MHTKGVCRGSGQVPMSGQWELTVSAKCGGKKLGAKKVDLTAK